jgi:hypothetical protein
VSRARRLAGYITSWSRPLAIYAVSRVVTVAALTSAMLVRPGLTAHQVFGAWDGAWYLDTARFGYPHSVPIVGGQAGKSTLGFFPLYPLLIRAGHAVGLPYTVSGIAVSTAFGGLAIVLVWFLAHELAGVDVADRTVLLLCFFPGSVVCSLVYSEPLMLALALACLFALIRKRWVVAGLCAALATAARPTGVALVACCVWCALEEIRRTGRRGMLALAAPLLAPVGMLTFFAFLHFRVGSASAYLRTQRDGWGERVQLTAIAHQLSGLHRAGSAVDLNVLTKIIGLVVIVCLCVVLVRAKLPVVLTVFSVTIVVLALVSRDVGARPRFIWMAFPLFIAAAQRLRGVALGTVVAGSAVLLGVYAMLVSMLVVTP